jgi:hypothetical protein
MFNYSTPILKAREDHRIELAHNNSMFPDIISRPYGLVENGEEFDLVTKKLIRAKRRVKRFQEPVQN